MAKRVGRDEDDGLVAMYLKGLSRGSIDVGDPMDPEIS